MQVDVQMLPMEVVPIDRTMFKAYKDGDTARDVMRALLDNVDPFLGYAEKHEINSLTMLTRHGAHVKMTDFSAMVDKVGVEATLMVAYVILLESEAPWGVVSLWRTKGLERRLDIMLTHRGDGTEKGLTLVTAVVKAALVGAKAEITESRAVTRTNETGNETKAIAEAVNTWIADTAKEGSL